MQNNGSDLLIRPMLPEDIPAVSVIEAEAFGESAWSTKALQAELYREDAVLFAALLRGELAGYAGIRIVLDEGYVGDIAVAPRLRRQGIGTALVRALIETGHARDLHFITLEARVSNESAIALYAYMGFQDVGVRRGFYAFPREDARLMTFYLR